MITLSAYDIKERRIVVTVDGDLVEHLIAVVRAGKITDITAHAIIGMSQPEQHSFIKELMTAMGNTI